MSPPEPIVICPDCGHRVHRATLRRQGCPTCALLARPEPVRRPA